MGGDAEQLARFIAGHRHLAVLTGAGVSAPSGIPTYRDHEGGWAHPAPVQYQEFLGRMATRQRYWSRSMSGWPRMAHAAPSPAHAALAHLESLGYLRHLVTQNVDGLHHKAGSRELTELHGSLAVATCLQCGAAESRAAIQARLQDLNPAWRSTGPAAPDGDAAVEADCSEFRVPDCQGCGGILKPGVVFFGEAIPAATQAQAAAAIGAADGVLVVGSSLMVFSGFRLVRDAARAGKPVAAINLGRTRADEFLAFKVVADCAAALPEVERLLC